ncbi:MAG: zf-HC2 domain-containing protein [Acidobacteriota bacterium]
MSDKMEGGSRGGDRPLPFGESHDVFLELCALSTANVLSAEERDRLSRHLASCAECREALAQYQSLASAGIPAAALAGRYEESPDSGSDWSLEDSEARLFARIEKEGEPDQHHFPNILPIPSFDGSGSPDNVGPRVDALWRHLWLQLAAALLLVVALGYTAYRIGVDRGTRAPRMAAGTSLPRGHLPAESAQAPASPELTATLAALRNARAQLAALDVRMRKQAAKVADLEAQNREAQSDRSRDLARQASLEQSRADLVRQLDAAEADLDQARQKLSDASANEASGSLQAEALRRQINELNTRVAERDHDLDRAQALLDHDRDIRDLMGSRNLYIAEVYDVARNGQTRKPFGRVFYTRGRSLIFYAYDLDQQPGVRDSSTFQAWGSRGSDRATAVNLGMFYQDDAAQKCWVLKAENPKALSGIDAVFVTVEPHGGSSRPSGKPLLYAYLHIEPNHP